MIDIVMAAQKLLTTMRHLDRGVDSCTPQEIADIIKFHSKGAAAAGVAVFKKHSQNFSVRYCHQSC